MPIGYGGKEYRNVYFNGTYWRTGYFNNRKVLAVPEVDPWLMVKKSGPKIYLAFNSTYNFVYTLDMQQIVEDTLSGEVG